MSTELATKPEAAKSKTGLSGVQKAAALLVAIGEQRAGEIFKYLGETEVEALSLELAKAQKVPTEVLLNWRTLFCSFDPLARGELAARRAHQDGHMTARFASGYR